MKKALPVMKKNCPTCPFVKNGWTEVRGLLEMRALAEASPICHSTGCNALVGKGSKKSNVQHVCRGARNLQLKFMAGIKVIDTPTDAAWAKKCKELGMQLA